MIVPYWLYTVFKWRHWHNKLSYTILKIFVWTVKSSQMSSYFSHRQKKILWYTQFCIKFFFVVQNQEKMPIYVSKTSCTEEFPNLKSTYGIKCVERWPNPCHIFSIFVTAVCLTLVISLGDSKCHFILKST